MKYLAKQSYGRLEQKMEHLACFRAEYSHWANSTSRMSAEEITFSIRAPILPTPVISHTEGLPHIKVPTFSNSPNEETVVLNN